MTTYGKIVHLRNNGQASTIFLVMCYGKDTADIFEDKTLVFNNYSLREIHPLDCKIILENTFLFDDYLDEISKRTFELYPWFTFSDGTQSKDIDNFSQKAINIDYRIKF